MVTPTPLVASDWFALRIRTLREASGLTPKQLAKTIGRSVTSVRQFEAPNRLVTDEYIEKSLHKLGRDDLVKPYQQVIGRSKTRKTLWWLDLAPDLESLSKSQKSSELTAFELLLNFEASAESLCVYTPHGVPDLAQAPGYTNAQCGLAAPLLPQHKALLPGRQAVLVQNEPDVRFLLDEAALRGGIGGPEVMREQVEYLLDLARAPNVTIQVVPPGGAGQAATECGFTLLRLPDELEEDPGAVFVKTAADWVQFRDADKVGSFRRRWATLRRDALTVEQSLALLERIASELQTP